MQNQLLGIRFEKVHGCITVYDGTRYLRSFELGKLHEIFNMIIYLVGIKGGIIYVVYMVLHMMLFNKASASKECDICHYWCFLDQGFQF